MKLSSSSIRFKKLQITAIAVVVSSVAFARAEARLPSIFADHMVVQRRLPVHVWGMATANETVSVTFRGESQRTTADSLGRWSVYLKPGEAGGPFSMDVRAANTIALQDVLVGDVWVASGQSNMEFPMAEGMNRGVNNEKAEIAAANYPQIRLLDIEPKSSDYPLTDAAIRRAWTVCTPASVAQFSAVGYLFARDLQQHQNVPIGVIDDTWGGTVAEAWTSLDALSANAFLMPVFAWRAKLMDALSTTLLQQKREQQEIEAAKAASKPIPEFPWHPDPDSWKPAGLYNAMIAPLTPFAIKGVIWYQGESNGDQEAVPIYGALFKTMIQDWRNDWAQGPFPFLFVQLPNWNPGLTWPELREQQTEALSLKNTGMAVTIDVGDPDNIHPKDKQDVAARLALAARAIAYGEQIEYAGPMFRQVTVEGRSLRVWFSHTGSGLISKNGTLRGFEVAGADQKYFPAQAAIDGETVLVSSASVAVPVTVRYGWAANPDCNLYNGANLPASPFQATAFNGK
ncbi:MAG: sialate O-acetylesterase [Acidobacteriaceae bacterium]